MQHLFGLHNLSNQVSDLDTNKSMLETFFRTNKRLHGVVKV